MEYECAFDQGSAESVISKEVKNVIICARYTTYMHYWCNILKYQKQFWDI